MVYTYHITKQNELDKYEEGFNDDEDDKLNSELKYIKDDIII